MQTLNEIRASFIDFFVENGHADVPSSPLVPHNDPTLMFTNAGMVQFKNVFTGVEKLPFTRAASSQKCVRAGGKHNDLDNVGYTARHHTFFEMLGNFSFGDYFKETAIELAWRYLTKTAGIPAEKMCVTIYHDDDEAFSHWKKISGLHDSKIIRIATADNFWSMGDTGPCGPCSEVFYDHGDKIPGGPPGSLDADGDRFIEIWNLVFMQFEQLADGTRLSLPKPSIDTGMGLERLSAVLQGVHDNYDIDLFRNLIAAIMKISGGGKTPDNLISYRVIADHLRSSCFLIADGVMPSNEGRGYVLRRIMRRAMRHAHGLGCKEPLMHKLVPALVAEMGKAYGELERAQNLISEVLLLEEERFKDTLGRGLKLLSEETEKMGGAKILPGEVAFKLYDTYGFPLDLTRDILRKEGKAVDEEGFESAMKQQRDMAKAAWKGSGGKATDEIWFDLKNELGATEFLGYEADKAQGKIVAIINNGARVEKTSAGEEVLILTNQTPFYGESGGQAGDYGFISVSGGTAEITDTQKQLGELHAHVAKITKGVFKVGDIAELSIDTSRRSLLRANHSVTHILHAVLRKHLGEHVAQKGSLVAAEKLRFDFSHPKPLAAEEIEAIEREVNTIVRGNTEVRTRLMPPEEAIKQGAMALFGEKYGEEVRVVTMGSGYSVELCGGTHVRRTGDIGLFKITSESAIAAGVRRIEAVTGDEAVVFVQAQEKALTEIAGALKAPQAEVVERVSALMEEKKRLEKELADSRKKAALSGGEAKHEKIGAINFITRSFDDLPANDLRAVSEELKKANSNSVVALFSVIEGKVSVIVSVSAELAATKSAVDLVKLAVETLGGKGGGGKPEMAQGGGVEPEKIEEAINRIKEKLK